MSKVNKAKVITKKNKTILPEFVELCKLTQAELKDILAEKLVKAGYDNVVNENGYLYAKGEIPVLLTAHMDTVHNKRIKNFIETEKNGEHHLASPEGIGGDDRCGIYMILDIIKENKCSVLFCEDEEKGGIGSRRFTVSKHIEDLKKLKYMIELDRAHSKDAVFYQCDNKEFTKFICDNTGYKESFGSFSDISTLAPVAEVAAVNLSCGYYNAHTSNEYVIIEEMLDTIDVVKNLLKVECDQFKYIRKQYSYGQYSFGSKFDNWRSGRGWMDDYYRNRRMDFYSSTYYEEEEEDDYFTTAAEKMKKQKRSSSNIKFADKENDLMALYVTYEDPNSFKMEEAKVTGNTKAELWWNFFRENEDVSYSMIYDYDYDYL